MNPKQEFLIDLAIAGVLVVAVWMGFTFAVVKQGGLDGLFTTPPIQKTR